MWAAKCLLNFPVLLRVKSNGGNIDAGFEYMDVVVHLDKGKVTDVFGEEARLEFFEEWVGGEKVDTSEDNLIQQTSEHNQKEADSQIQRTD